ncbi:ubiquitin-like modifier-activating enzyme ATG7 [Belonocnema kinseyi]|uniref:ubiquitin-like modifier-activating enzyme ATG7 n=1 Tax=Belonocnema kinseyi TaxID=2817044 RepID=UPI00143DCE2F|nr:ubiquitin-like modifier-activating enzyme ATG7 [Belonocnema kinseyi]XP_033223573.1 ubiquitin-like modifier-activating enzyme ATG7 [Belonocnema kinseyi]XP_033223574.1 ubiquitin-like modifier-activating enzyme ATG7 [Belonocnema kinseyi]
MADNVVKFSKLRSATESSFWAKFSELKIDKFKLEDKIDIPLWGSYSLDDHQSNPLFLDYTSFNENLETTSHDKAIACNGFMLNTNTFELFKQTDPEKFIDLLGKYLIEAITSGTAIKEPWRLSLFLMLSFSDLKKYKFYYWVAHPTPYNLPETYYQRNPMPICDEFTSSQIEEMQAGFLQLDSKSKSFFSVFVSTENNSLKITSLAEGIEFVQSLNLDSKKSENNCNIYFSFYDPCGNLAPGWPLRNLLCLLFWHAPNFSFHSSINFLSIRGSDLQKSIIYTLISKVHEDVESVRKSILEGRFVGWESNANGKMGPNIADLSDAMDPIKLSSRAVNLNLKLIKWRLVPELDLEKISGLRCLLLGAGTLGCSVARVLLGWGVHTITFVDNSVVSHSNTVRQSLYTHEDAVKRRHKAEAAKEALIKIQPSLNAEGVVLQIPMPGHVVGKSMMESTKQALIKLEELYAKHDVVFLLLDSREARWLPTVLCAAINKIAINAALGFDSYTVQRHGTRNSQEVLTPDLMVQNPTGKDLGCYFCNDITQPGNSQTDRTLDQQCTVSRPGLSYIASGLAVELLVALTQHPDETEAAALMDDSKDQGRSNKNNSSIGLLGGIPHTIRGSLWGHEMRLTITHRFPSCTACSYPVINEYKERGFSFVLDACNEPNYLEKLAGLEDLLKRPDLDEFCYALDSSDEEENS